MRDYKTLNDLHDGETAIIHRVYAKPSMHRRLLDIGLIEGTEIECIGRSPLSDPIAFLIRGAVIAIRSEDCKNVLIKN